MIKCVIRGFTFNLATVVIYGLLFCLSNALLFQCFFLFFDVVSVCIIRVRKFVTRTMLLFSAARYRGELNQSIEDAMHFPLQLVGEL